MPAHHTTPSGLKSAILQHPARAVETAFRSERLDYYTDYFRRLAHAEAEAGIVTQHVRRSTWNYQDSIADQEYEEADYTVIGQVTSGLFAQQIRAPIPLETATFPFNRRTALVSGGFLHADLLADPAALAPLDGASQHLLRQEIDEVLATLPSRQSRVLVLRFGLEDDWPQTLEEIGVEFGVTRERIRQIEAKALKQLRHPVRAKKLRDYLDGAAPAPSGTVSEWFEFWRNRLQPVRPNGEGELAERGASEGSGSHGAEFLRWKAKYDQDRYTGIAAERGVSVSAAKAEEAKLSPSGRTAQQQQEEQEWIQWCQPVPAWLRGRWGAIRLGPIPRVKYERLSGLASFGTSASVRRPRVAVSKSVERGGANAAQRGSGNTSSQADILKAWHQALRRRAAAPPQPVVQSPLQPFGPLRLFVDPATGRPRTLLGAAPRSDEPDLPEPPKRPVAPPSSRANRPVPRPPHIGSQLPIGIPAPPSSDEFAIGEENDIVTADRGHPPPPSRTHQQPLDLPGALPLFDARAPATPAAAPPPPAEPVAQLPFVPPETPPIAASTPEHELLRSALEAFRKDGCEVADLRPQGGYLWVYDQHMKLAHKIDGLRPAVRFLFAEHEGTEKWGWRLK